jgi:hypothetical protein
MILFEGNINWILYYGPNKQAGKIENKGILP